MDRRGRGQASLEFIINLGIVLMILTMMTYIVYKSYVKSNDLKVYIYGQRLANHIAEGINDLNAVGSGYSTTIDIPANLYGNMNYTVSFYENESSVFLKGSGFASSEYLTFTSPISTDNVHCILSQCHNKCNRTLTEKCLLVNSSMELRFVSYAGGIYIAPENIVQGSLKKEIVPYDGNGDMDPDNPPKFVTDLGNWNVMLVHRNLNDDSMSLVFSTILTGTDTREEIDLYDIQGDVLEARSNDEVPLELDLAGYPAASWRKQGATDVDGGVIKFVGGFHVCMRPIRMPSAEWVFMNADGTNVTLNKTVDVCVSYP